MRYSIYKYVSGLSNSIFDAVSHVNSVPTSVGLILDCVEAISAINTTLCNENIKLVEVEQFLEVVQNIIGLIEKNENYNDELKKLLDLSEKIKNFCENIQYKIKAVFFAELGSKWDSMDSVYRAFCLRDDSEVEVVIAPIFRAIKDNEGKVISDVIYEDFLTPMGIKHTPFNEYDIKKDRPDFVFTSQPYESVTPEQFWAENIAPYTHLVYLPYFIATQGGKDSSVYTKCEMPMHQLAWKVICQSEKVKSYYSRFAQNGGINLVAMGLPKWDWVTNMNSRNIELPKGWEKLDGKKIILYNVHYTLEGNPEEALNNVKGLLKIAENEKYGVIFRFHPMIETMFKVYYSKYKNEWEDLKATINASKGCVIDNETMYDASFKFSDFLWSYSFSSLIPQYLLTGKPAIFATDKYWKTVEDRLFDEGEVFIKLYELGAVCSLNEADNKMRELLDGEDTFREQRLKLLNEYMPGIDGDVGKRITEYLINELKNED